jgi:hypothetical protein
MRERTGLVYITGMAGTGKSSLQKRLSERGYESIDSDHGYCAFYDKQTGEAITGPPRKLRTPKWLETHEWQFIPDKLDELHIQARDKLLFLCGTANNEADYRHCFIKIFALMADDETIARRLRERPGEHAYGKSDHELELTLAANQNAADRYTKLGAVFIDAIQPLDTVIDEILRAI